MALLKYVKDLDRKFAWSFLGVVLAVTFGTITIYREFIQNQRPTLRYDVLTSTSVLDVKEEVSNLNVLFDGVDIRKQGLSLRVITLRVVNDSPQDILKGFYDDHAPLGVALSAGKIIKSEVAGASNGYLTENLVLSASGERSVLFPGLIIEAGQSFTLKFLVLHPKNDIPTLKALGKVAGIPSIPIREAYRDQDREPFLQVTFHGGLLVQGLRLIVYTLGVILMLVCTIVPIVLVSAKLDERKRRRTVEEFRGVTKLDLKEVDEYVFSRYVERGAALLVSMNFLISDPDELAAAYTRHREHKAREKADKTGPPLDRYEQDYVVDIWFHSQRIDDYLKAGVLKDTGKGLVPDEHVKKTLEHFLRFLRNKGLLTEKDDFLKANRELAEIDRHKDKY